MNATNKTTLIIAFVVVIVLFLLFDGGSVTALGEVFGTYKRTVAQIGGVIVIMFGLATLEVIRLPWFYADTRAQYSGQRGTYGGSALMGIFFSSLQVGARALARRWLRDVDLQPLLTHVDAVKFVE